MEVAPMGRGVLKTTGETGNASAVFQGTVMVLALFVRLYIHGVLWGMHFLLPRAHLHRVQAALGRSVGS